MNVPYFIRRKALEDLDSIRKIGAKISDKIWIQYKYFVSSQSEFLDKIQIQYEQIVSTVGQGKGTVYVIKQQVE